MNLEFDTWLLMLMTVSNQLHGYSFVCALQMSVVLAPTTSKLKLPTRTHLQTCSLSLRNHELLVYMDHLSRQTDLTEHTKLWPFKVASMPFLFFRPT